MRWKLAALLIAAVGVGASYPATVAAHSTPDRPLVFAVVIDGLDGDNVDAGDAPFLSSLIRGEAANTTYYRQSRAVMVAETNPNHTAMMTGAYTDRSGIAGNSFALYRELVGEEDDEAETCEPAGPVDQRSLPTETSGEHASCLVAETVFEAIKKQGNREAYASAGIFGKAKLGRLFSSRRSNGRPYADHLWAPCTPDDGSSEKEYCGNVPLEPVNNDRTILDSLVMDEVIDAVRNGVGHDRRIPDFALVNLPNVDNAGHALGGGGLAYELAIRLADAEIERLVNELKAQGVWGRSVLVVLSDHSHDTTLQPITLTSALEDSGVASSDFMIIDNGNADMVYLADRKAGSRHQLLKQMRQVILAQPGVDLALYRRPNPADGGVRHTIDMQFPGWHAAGTRTGDILVVSKPGVRFSDPSAISNPLLGNHGGWHTLDNTFLVSSGGLGVRHQVIDDPVGERFSDTIQNPKQAENVDLASTVMGLLGMSETKHNRGRFLQEAFRRSQLPGKTKPSAEALVSGVAIPRRKGWTLRVHWGPWKAAWQVQRRRGKGRWRTVTRETRRRRIKIKVKRPGRHTVRVRAISASGKKGFWTGTRLRAR